jgi:hypothetical protein
MELTKANSVTNPMFGTNATGWSALNGTIARNTVLAGMVNPSTGAVAPFSGLLTATAANAEARISQNLSAVTRWLQMTVRNNNASARTAQLTYNSVAVGSSVVVAAGATARLTASVTGTGTSVPFGVQWSDSINGDTFSILHAGTEPTTLTSPIPEVDASGVVTTGYTWGGTAHASVATRATATVKCDETGRAKAPRGSVAAWYYHDVNPASTQSLFSVGTVNAVGRDFIELAAGTADQIRLLHQNNNIGGSEVDGVALDVDAWNFMIGGWSMSFVEISKNLNLRTIKPYKDGTSDDISTASDLSLGTRNSLPSVVIFGRLGPVAVFDRPLTPTQRRRLFRLGPWWTFEGLMR